jgi:hypothetical protein
MPSWKTSSLTPAITLGTLTIAVLMVLIVSSPTLSSSTTMADLNQPQPEEGAVAGTESIIEADKEDPTLVVTLLANELETRLNKSGAILEITSRLPEVNSTPFASSISPELHGIPRDADIPKRKVAQDILAADKDFQVIFFLMPNGDMYLEEPYSLQENLTRNNFAFRDYYKGAVETGNTYLGNVIISAATGSPQAYIATPMYSENSNDGTHLVGLWTGGLNLTNLSKSLQSLNLTAGQRVVYVDSNGSKIADSDANNTNPQESFANLTSFKNAIINGQSGSAIETIGNTKMIVTYQPVNVFHNTWAVLLMQQQPLPQPSNQTINSEQLLG